MKIIREPVEYRAQTSALPFAAHSITELWGR